MAEDARNTPALRLRDMFPPVSTATWEAAIARDLKGAGVDTLVWRPEPGIVVRPFYRQEDLADLDAQLAAAPGEFPFVRGMTAGCQASQGWAPPPEAIRADVFHDAGATAVQELGFALAEGVDRVVDAVRDGRSPADAIGGAEFVFAVGSAYFLEIAKLRAARLLWAQASAAFGVVGEGALMRMHVRTARANKTVEEGVTNLLRVTTEALSAIIGGCGSLTLESPGFDSHLAENVHRIIREESHLDAVCDPAGGSYYIEALTDALASEAWGVFQGIERQGGFAAARQSGSIQAALDAARAEEVKAAASRRPPAESSGQDT